MATAYSFIVLVWQALLVMLFLGTIIWCVKGKHYASFFHRLSKPLCGVGGRVLCRWVSPGTTGFVDRVDWVDFVDGGLFRKPCRSGFRFQRKKRRKRRLEMKYFD
ncbi:MAG: hypothetical protein ACOX9C_11790 [Kiritimatiellia bacterium]